MVSENPTEFIGPTPTGIRGLPYVVPHAIPRCTEKQDVGEAMLEDLTRCPYFVSHAVKAAGTIIRPMYLARGAWVCWEASELGDPNAAYGSCLAPRV